MARSSLIVRATGFVLVALGLIALTAGPSIVDMNAIRFLAGIPAPTVDLSAGGTSADPGVPDAADVAGPSTRPLFSSPVRAEPTPSVLS
jgi:hypothetical protein